MALLPASALAATWTTHVSINSGDIGTNLTAVTVSVSADLDGVAPNWMRFRQEFGTSGGSWNPAIILGGWSAWEPYNTTKALTLTTSPSNPYGEGTHWVTAEFNSDVTEPWAT